MVVEKKTVVVMGFPYLGNIVRRAGVIPRYLPTKDELSKDIQFLPQDQFIAKMQEYYRRYHIETEVVGTEVRTHNTTIFCFLVFCFLFSLCDQKMTENDYARHCLDYYEGKQESMGDDGGKKISVQPESGVKECDSSIDNELFGPIWDDINVNKVLQNVGRELVILWYKMIPVSQLVLLWDSLQ